MKIGYMTNGFGMLVGSGGGVTSAKDIRYLSLIDDKAAFETIKNAGYEMIEMFDGNLDRFASNPEELQANLQALELTLGGVYIGANFIYEDSFEDELSRIQSTSKLALDVGAKHIVLGGGAIRSGGILESDYVVLAKNLDKAASAIKALGLIPSYHPHLGSMVESPEQLHKIFSLTDIDFCPDIAHLFAGGGDPLKLVEQYYDRIPYIHLKDFNDRGFVPLGEGDIDLKGILKLLKEKGFSGDILAEIDGFDGDPDYACRVSMDFIREHI